MQTRHLIRAATVGAVLLFATSGHTQSTLPAEVQAHIAAATAAAGSDLKAALTQCDRVNLTSVPTREEVGNDWLNRVNSGKLQPIEPTRVFDNLYFVGQRWVSAWVLTTSRGLILIDAMDNRQEAADYIESGLRQLGLDPRDIKFLLVTHAHFDHYGGAQYLVDKYATRLVMSETDWKELAHVESRGNAMDFGTVPQRNPNRDIAVQDGDTLTLGDTTVTLFVTPGHTPGTLSLVFTVKDQGRTHRAMLWGGTAFNFGRLPDRLITYGDSTRHFGDVLRRAQVDVLLSNHVTYDDTVPKLAALKQRKSGESHPFVVGTEVPQRYLTVLRECALATRASIAPVERGEAPLLQGEIGTWKFNPAKSQYEPGPPPLSQISVRVPAGQGVKVTTTAVDATGHATETLVTANYDSKDYPVTGNPTYDTQSIRRIDDYSFESIRKKDGKVVQTGGMAVSQDGKVITVKQKGTNAQGQPFNNVVVWDKQGTQTLLQGEIGTWKLNVEKSKYDPGPGRKSGMSTRERAGSGVRVTTEMVDGEGKSIPNQSTFEYDGKDYPLTGNSAYDAVSYKLLDAFNASYTRTNGGKVVETATIVMSMDGRVLTVSTEGTDSQGRPFNNVAVWEKQ